MTALRQRFIEDLQLRNRSPPTIEIYVYHLREYASYFHLSPDQLSLDHAHRYILYLLKDKKVSWSAYHQPVSALRFFYRVTCPREGIVTRLPYGKRPRKLPTVRSTDEVACFLDGEGRGGRIGRTVPSRAGWEKDTMLSRGERAASGQGVKAKGLSVACGGG
jgi:site-specific recombinase XerD